MSTTPYTAEFRGFLDSQLAGKTPAERRGILQYHLTRAQREGWVPVQGGLVASAPTLRQRSWARPAQPSAGSVTRTAGPRISRWRLIIAVPLLLMLLTMVLPGSEEQRPRVPTMPVTAQDGRAAPVALTLGARTLAVRTFDPTKGWPDARQTPDAALWGGTTINVVLALDGAELEDELDQLQPGATLRLQQASGDTVTYRVTEQVTADAAAIDHASQRQVGLTLVGLLRGRARRVVHAVPADVPVPLAVLGDVRVEAGQPRWAVALDAAPTLAVSLTLTAGQEPLAGTVVVDAEGTVTRTDVGSVAAGTTTVLVVEVPAGNAAQRTLAVTLPTGQRGSVAVPVPPLPSAAVAWGSARSTLDGVAVTVTLTADGPLVLHAEDFSCRSTAGSQPMQVQDLTLPRLLAAQETLMVQGRCSTTSAQRGQVLEVQVAGAAATLVLP